MIIQYAADVLIRTVDDSSSTFHVLWAGPDIMILYYGMVLVATIRHLPYAMRITFMSYV